MAVKLKTCPVCGQTFDVRFYAKYAYKKSINRKIILFCGYNCMRTAEKQLEETKKEKNDGN